MEGQDPFTEMGNIKQWLDNLATVDPLPQY